MAVAVRADEALGSGVAGIYQSGVRPGGHGSRGLAARRRHRAPDGGAHGEGRDAGAAVPAEAIKAYVGGLHAGARWSRPPQRRHEVSGPVVSRDDVRQAACIVGTAVKDWQKVDFAGLKGRSEFEGKEIGAGPGTNVMGSALISLAWLANKLTEHGKHLKAGDVILTGSVHPPVFLPGPGMAKTEFVGLGGTETSYK